MASNKPSIPKGTRDFLPLEMVRRNYIFDIIRETFITYGFQPLETPAMENLTTLLGKYGDEGDKLLFRILNSGDFLKKADDSVLGTKDSLELSSQICDRGLRYDLTVPFARFVVQHRNEINLPFKRYQIQPVWRADRPQKGRYREFTQAGCEIIGTDTPEAVSELIAMAYKILENTGLKNINLNIGNLKILQAINKK